MNSRTSHYSLSCRPRSYRNLGAVVGISVVKYATNLYAVRTVLECQFKQTYTCEIRCVGAILLS